MSCVVELSRARFWSRAAALALMTIGLAACSGEASRFNDYRNGPEATGSIPPAQPTPAASVESQPLSSPTGAPQAAAAGGSSGTAGGGHGMASYSPSPTHANAARSSTAGAREVTGSVNAPKSAASGNWTWEGGKAITVAPGETIDALARRYGVPPSAISQANNIAPTTTLRPGQQLVIPRYGHAPVATAPASKPVANAASPTGNPAVHVVASGDTLTKISRHYGKPISEIVKANNIQATAKLNVGDRLIIPGARVSAAKPNATPVKPAVVQGQAAAPVTAPEVEPVASASVVTPVTDTPAAKEAVKSAEGTGALPKFRWPANGRVIASFGPSTNGQQNDGINIALPENTPVKAAEDGVVAYAGNELKGYGNLVLVRHPNGYVTAYAHAKELLVKRGDPVKRGQVIARSGQTGNVNAPQLHFEIRKGASPLDPTRFLNGA